MTDPLALSEADLAALDRALAALGAQPPSFSELVRRYQALVRTVETYDFSRYDYENDIDARRLIEEALPGCSVAVQIKARAVLQPIDSKFLERTVEGPGEGWHSRVPANPGPEYRA